MKTQYLTRYGTRVAVNMPLPSDRYVDGRDADEISPEAWQRRYYEDLAAITGALPGEF